MLWNPDILEVSSLLVSDQVVHVRVTIIQKQSTFLASFIYRLHTRREQAELWHSLLNVSGSAGLIPWIVLGDFNVVRKPEETLGGNLHWSDACEDLDRCCAEIQLDDLRFSGRFLT